MVFITPTPPMTTATSETHVLFLLKVRRGGGRDVREPLLDALAQPFNVGVVAHLEQKGVDLARLAADRLRVLQQDHGCAVFKRLARLINAHDAVAGLVEAKRIAHLLVHILRCRSPKEERPSAPAAGVASLPGKRCPLHHLEMVDGKALRVIAIDDEIRRPIGGCKGIDHLRYLLHPRQTVQDQPDGLIHGAKDNVHRLVLHHQQVSPAAPRDRGIARDKPIGQRPQSHHRRHPDGNAERGQQCTYSAAKEILKNHSIFISTNAVIPQRSVASISSSSTITV
jgi:hypothetical protein